MLKFVRSTCWLTLSLVAVPVDAARPAAAKPEIVVTDALLGGLVWREVGPYRGGRSAAVEGIATQPLTYYFGSTGGGVWKTMDGGASWENVSDGFFGGSIGAVAVAPSDPNVVYVGGGEKTVRGNVSHGDGIWKSTDAGATWKHSGLPDSRHVPRLRVHPRDPDLVYAAVLGHLFGPSDERGVYRSRDGGKSWQRILFANRDAGAVDLLLDPNNPRVLYATTWRVRRTPWGLDSGGEGSGLWKSTDGGDTWLALTANKGLPTGTLGIIGIAVSPTNSQNLYAIVEAAQGGVFRSRDGGLAWEKTSDSRELRQRAWYYTRLVADPSDEDTVYVLNVNFHKSKDGGKTFSTIRVPHGDNHDLWIAPNDPLRMIEANDGGATVSTDGGATWTTQDNQPTAQFYRVSTDNAFPYRLLGGQQDNSAVRLRSRSGSAGIGDEDWEATAGGESGHIVADPADADRVFGGSYGGYLTMFHHRTQEFRDVNPWPDNPMGWGAADLTYRFQWNFPIVFSPHDPATLYAGANVVFRSRDHGSGWQAISPDLTRNDKTKMAPSGGPITKDNTSVEYYGTVFAIAESPVQRGLLWSGSDDGLVQVSRDDGQTWTAVTPKSLPEWAQINSLEASPFDACGLYLAATRYKLDDFRPYLFKTTDCGATWTPIVDGIASDHFTRVVRSDPKRRGLLYAGTERGVYVSLNDGAGWQSLQLELPLVPITDLAVKEDDLIAATQGRGFWILDDLTPLHQLTATVAAQSAHLFAPRATFRLRGSGGPRVPRNQGTNPPNGVVVRYTLVGIPEKTPLKLEFLAADGSVLRQFAGTTRKEESKPTPAPAGDPSGTRERPGIAAPATAGEAAAIPDSEKTGEPKKKPEEPEVPGLPGMNRFVWDLRLEDPKKFEGMVLWGGDGARGPRILPGDYRVRLSLGEARHEAPFAVKADPRVTASAADLQGQYEFLLGVTKRLTEIHTEIRRIREVRAEIAALKKRLGDAENAKPILEAAGALDQRMTAVEEALYQTQNKSPQDPLNFPIRLNDKLASLAESVGAGDFAPTAQAIAVRAQLEAAAEGELAKLRALWEQDLAALNRLMREREVPAIGFAPDAN
jgi:photosystem II stability/assembly factor-like uncharacterized protein